MISNTHIINELRQPGIKVLISGAAGNLGQALSWHLLQRSFPLKLMEHRSELPEELTMQPHIEVYRADLAQVVTLREACQDADCIVQLAGKLFAPHAARFLPETNVTYVQNLVAAALDTGVKKFILVSFPHVEGESDPDHPALGKSAGSPQSIHARTRLQAEQHLFKACEGTKMIPVVLRAGLIYGKGVKMIEAARRLMRRHLLGVWRKKTWMHLISLPDFLMATQAAIEGEQVQGIYNLGDDRPLTLQAFLDRVADHWGFGRPWRAPVWIFFLAASIVEAYALAFKTPAPLTRDFIKIGMASYVMDNTWMKADLISHLRYPTLEHGIEIL
jgi:nucleoside-diphosphate-sugar epimerase